MISVWITAVGSALGTTITFTPIEDATIVEAVPAGNFGSDPTLTASTDGFLREAAALLKFDLTRIPPGSTIHSASLELHLRSTDGTPPVRLDVWEVTSGWDETTVTWSTPRSWNCCYASTDVGFTSDVQVSWNVRGLMSLWAYTPGFTRIRSLALRGPLSYERTFDSREGTIQPRLTVDFTPPLPDGQIIVTIEEAVARDKEDDTIFGAIFGDNEQDFYVMVSIDGGPFERSRTIEGHDRAMFGGRGFSVARSVIKAQRFFPVTIELMDHDSTSEDDPFDIDPGPSKKLELLYDSCLMRWTRNSDGMSFGPGLQWTPKDNELSLLGDDAAKITINITNVGGPFAPNDVAIINATPVQAVYNPERIIAGKPTAFRVELVSSMPSTAVGSVSVTMSDGVTAVTDTKGLSVPPTGTNVSLFDGSGIAPPFVPTRVEGNPNLTYSVNVTVMGEGPPESTPPWFNCIGENNVISGASLKIVNTHVPRVFYRRWDWFTTPPSFVPAPPSFTEVSATAAANAPLQQAIFPVATSDTTVLPDEYITPYSPASSPLIDVLPDLLTFEPGQTLLVESVAAMVAGFEREILMPRENWFGDNEDLSLIVNDDALGLSAAEWGPHAVIAEAGRPDVAVHELGHTYRQSQHKCAEGGIGEDWFGLGCRDEYNHSVSDGAPYPAIGLDVAGLVYPAGFGGIPGTREVNTINIMAASSATFGMQNRWIDRLMFNSLTEQLRIGNDPELISIAGVVWAKAGFAATDPNLVGALLPVHRFMGVPDMEQAPLGTPRGSGQFAVVLETQQGNRIYRFTPWIRPFKNGKGDIGVFAFSVPWEPGIDRIELAASASPGDPTNSQIKHLFLLKSTPSAPKINTVRAGLDVTPEMAGPQPDPPAIPAGRDVVIAWRATDPDTNGPLRYTLLLRRVQANPGEWLHYASLIKEESFRIPHRWFETHPGFYQARLLASDGLNSVQFDTPNLFQIVQRARTNPPVITKQPMSQLALPGERVVFSVEVKGDDPLSFQWRLNQQPIAGATLPYLALPNVQPKRSSGLYDVIVSNPAGAITTAVARLSVLLYSPSTGLNEWLSSQFPANTPPALMLPGANPDNDSFPNAVEFAFGMNPNAVGEGVDHLPKVGFTTVNGRSFGTIRFRRPHDIENVRFIVEVSDTLGDHAQWVPIDGDWTIVPGELDGLRRFDDVIVRDDVPAEGPGRFYRIRVDVPGPDPSGLPATGESLRVGFYNAQFLIPLPQTTDGCCEDIPNRSRLLAQRIRASEMDVIALTEMQIEDDKRILVSELAEMYPHFIQYLDAPGSLIAQDSGLMLFSKFPFETLPVGTPGDLIPLPEDLIARSAGGEWRQVAFTKFRDCAEADCLANKGAGLVRIRNPHTDRIYNVVFTHLNSKASDVRRSQMAQIRSMIETVIGDRLESEPVLMLGDLNINGDFTLPERGTSAWFEHFGNPASFYASTLQDVWSIQTENPALAPEWWDRGLTGSIHSDSLDRPDYILFNFPRATVDNAQFCVQHMALAYQLRDGAPFVPSAFGFAGVQDLSDHFGIMADINLQGPRCNPRSALANPLLDRDASDRATLIDGEIRFPGSMQWFRFDQPGTYSFAIDPPASEMEFRIFDSRNMSSPLRRYRNDIRMLRDGAGQSHVVEVFDVPYSPFFVRVQHPSRTMTGTYRLVVRRHEGSSRDDSLALTPNSATPRVLAVSTEESTESGERWFHIDTERTTSGIGRQNITTFLEPTSSTVYEIRLEEPGGTIVAGPRSGSGRQELTLNNFEGGPRLFLHVGVPPGVRDTWRAGWSNDLTVLHPFRSGYCDGGNRMMSIQCVDQSDEGIDEDDDDVEFEIEIREANPPHRVRFVHGPFVLAENWDEGAVVSVIAQVGTIRFAADEELLIRLVEDDDGFLTTRGDDDFIEGIIHALGPDNSCVTRLDLNDTDEDGTTYRFRFNLTHGIPAVP